MLRYNKKGKFNIPFGRYKTYNYENLKNTNYEDLLKRTEIFNKSFEHIFNNYNDSNNFMFSWTHHTIVNLPTMDIVNLEKMNNTN